MRIFILIAIFMLSSCVHRSEFRDGFSLYIDNEDLINHGYKIELVKGAEDYNYSKDIYELKFDPIRGGRTNLIGRKSPSNSLDEYKRIKILKDEHVQFSFSFKDIIKMNYRILNDSIRIYTIPIN